tara:strand:- start:5134 stop:11928 length:6795 start_codon:yes stop_codon:yes gene_type:complete
MNKDLDERLVRNGEYRDAQNIQVRTTDSTGNEGEGDAGTAQNVKGNSAVGQVFNTTNYQLPADNTRIIATKADEKNDFVYFFAASPPALNNSIAQGIQVATILQNAPLGGRRVWVDSIVRVSTLEDFSEPVFVDRYAITEPLISGAGDTGINCFTTISNLPNGTTTPWNTITVVDGYQYRVGMKLFIQSEAVGGGIENLLSDEDGNVGGIEIASIDGNELKLRFEQTADLTSNPETMVVKAVHPERVLEFDYENIITNSVNIVDNLIFWSDGVNEPKKINIERSIAGTIIEENNFNGFTNSSIQSADSYLIDPKHTKLFVNDPNNDLLPITSVENLGLNDEATAFADDVDIIFHHADVKKENVTVIRKKPVTPPSLIMSDTDRPGMSSFTIDYPIEDGVGGGFVSYYTSPTDFDLDGEIEGNFEIDYGIVEEGDEVASIGSERVIPFPNNVDVRLNDIFKFTSTDVENLSIGVVVQVIEVGLESADEDNTYHRVRCTFVDELLETYVPKKWAVELEQKDPLFETKFGRFGYRYKYEDGECSAFSPWSELAFLPGTFLYTAKEGHNIGMANKLRKLTVIDFIPDDSIRPNDVRTVDILWKTTDDSNVYVVKSITRELNQEWEDFVNGAQSTNGSLTITSEMINRVLPSNQILRTWDNVPRSALAQEVTAGRLVYGNYLQGYDINTIVGLKQAIVSEDVDFPIPKRSVKTMRSYKWGMVFGDENGRETPVLASGFKTFSGETITGDTTVDKFLCGLSNKFELQQEWQEQPLDWMSYVKYYVKETSNEYYNLILDRWYDSGDGAVWLAFPSSDRNKVDEETYLLLKNGHGNQNIVFEKARYRILAIENDAPDFIKRRERLFNKIRITREGIYDVENGENPEVDTVPKGLINTTRIYTSTTYVNQEPIVSTSFNGDKEVRLVGEFDVYQGPLAGTTVTAESPFKLVTQIYNNGVSIAEAFTEEEADMYQKIRNRLAGVGVDSVAEGLPDTTLVDNGSINDEEDDQNHIRYYYQYRDVEIVNSPEFDGRFFAKIKKDNTLEQQVLNSANVSYTVEAGQTYDIAYIANKSQNPSPAANGLPFSGDTSQAYSDTVFGSGNFTISTVDDYVSSGSDNYTGGTASFYGSQEGSGIYPEFHASQLKTIPAFGPGNFIKTRNFWQTWNENKTTNIFIDEAPAAYGYNRMFTLAEDEDLADQDDNPWVSHQGYILSKFDCGYYEDGDTSKEFQPLPVSAFANYPKQQLGDSDAPSDNSNLHVYGQNPTYGVLTYLYSEFSSRNRMSFIPPGLSQGKATGNELGQLAFSIVTGEELVDQWNESTGVGANFKLKMQNVGQYFRFADDPGQVYVVIENKEVIERVRGNNFGEFQMHGNANMNAFTGGDRNIIGFGLSGGDVVNGFDSLNFDFYDGINNPDGNNLQYYVDPNAIGIDGFTDFEGPITMGTSKRRPIVNFFESGVSTQNTTNADANAFYDPSAPALFRSSIIVRFARVDSLGLPIEGTGINPGSFDPRGLVTHDGLGSFKIEFLNMSVDSEVSSDFIETAAACFETEPKENVDIDLYYEASPAIPIVLKENNIQSYINSSLNRSVASNFYIKPRSQNPEDSSINNLYPSVDPTAFASNFYGDDGVLISRVTQLGPDFFGNFIDTSLPLQTISGEAEGIVDFFAGMQISNGVSVGDQVCFRRNNGFQTETKILDHYDLASGLSGKQGLRLSRRFTFTIPSTDDNGNPLVIMTDEVPGGGTALFIFNNILDTNGNAILAEGADGSLGSVASLGMNVFDDGTVNGTGNVLVGTNVNFSLPIFGGILVFLNNKLQTASEYTLTFAKQTGVFKVDTNVWKYPVKLPWFNCYSFGNGVESDRIRDDFNAPQIDNGCRVSSTFLEYGEERIGSGLIHSGLYNSVSSVNNLNEFNMAEKITKNLNPAYGSIQALKTRQNNIAVFTEDKVLKVLANKDAVFNADGNPQLVATNRVLGDATPYAGDYGISNNPESLAGDQYRLYFTDQQRGAVLRLSRDGITPISNIGMKTYFRNNLRNRSDLIGSFDVVNGEYNLYLRPGRAFDRDETLSFNEAGKGWVSFKTFYFSTGVSCSGNYYTTAYDAESVPNNNNDINISNYIWQHHITSAPITIDALDQLAGAPVGRNTFYGTFQNSTIEVVFNDLPGVIKSFRTMNYEGSQASVTENNQDGEFYNLNNTNGWFVSNFRTDLQIGEVFEFIEKENKWFNRIISRDANQNNFANNTDRFTHQGIGFPLLEAENTVDNNEDQLVNITIDDDEEDE